MSASVEEEYYYEDGDEEAQNEVVESVAAPSPTNELSGQTKGDKLRWNTVKRLAFGSNFGLAVGTNDSGEPQVYGWGVNDNNVLALGDEVEESVYPTRVSALDGKKCFDISAGLYHCAAVVKLPNSAGGKVYTWGLGTLGRLGYVRDAVLGEPADPYAEEAWYTSKPYKVRFPDKAGKIARVCCGGYFTYYLTEHGQLYVNGWSQSGALGFGEDVECIWSPTLLSIIHGTEEEFVTHVACGVDHVICCCRSGRVYSWGDGRLGRLGHNDEECRYEPTRVEALASETITFVSAGNTHSAAIDRSERAWLWGSGDSSKLGSEDNTNRLTPYLLTSLQRVSSIALGANHSIALTTDYKAFIWGAGPAVGAETMVPIPVAFSDPIIAITSGLASASAFTDQGDLLVWGRAPLGLLDESDQIKPITVAELRRRGYVKDLVESALKDTNQAAPNAERMVDQTILKTQSPSKDIACGSEHTLLVTPNGQVWGWGDNTYGQLGDPSIECSREPVRIPIPAADLPIRSVSCGAKHSLCVTANNTLIVFGCGNEGQLCTGRTADETTPLKITNTQGRVLRAVAGPDYSALILAPRATTIPANAADDEIYGELWVCGNSDNGKLGVPVEMGVNVVELRRVRAVGSEVCKVACGQSHMCCLTRVGDIFVWGTGKNGRLGTNSQKNETEPVQITAAVSAAYGRVIDIACGDAHSMALTNQGIVFVWGSAIGLGSVTDLLVPTNFTIPLRGVLGSSKDLSFIKSIKCGARHAGCVSRTGKLIMFGCNTSCQVEGDSTESKKSPTLIEKVIGCESLALGTDYTCCSTRKGMVFSWGATAKGKLGIGEISQPKSEIQNVLVCWDCEAGDVDADETSAEPVRVRQIGKGTDPDDIIQDLLELDKPSILVLQKALKYSYETISSEALLKLETDTQHLFGKLIDRLVKEYEVESQLKSSTAGGTDSLASVRKLHDLFVQKLFLCMNVQPRHSPSIFDITQRYLTPFGTQSSVMQELIKLRCESMTHLQTIVETIVLQPAYWIIIIPFLKTQEHRDAYCYLLAHIYHDVTDPYIESAAVGIMRAVGRREIMEGRSLLDSQSIYHDVISTFVFGNHFWLSFLAAPLILHSLEPPAKGGLCSVVDLMQTLSTGQFPVELHYLSLSQDEFEEHLKAIPAHEPDLSASTKAILQEILSNRVTLKKQYETAQLLLEPLLEHMANVYALGHNQACIWREFMPVLKTQMEITDVRNYSAFIVKSIITSILLRMLEGCEDICRKLNFPALNHREIHNLRVIASVLREGYNGNFSTSANAKAFASFEAILGDRVSKNIGAGNGAQAAAVDLDVHFVSSFFLAHIRHIKGELLKVRVPLWALMTLLNLYRESEPRLKILSSFDPLIQNVRQLCPSTSSLPFEESLIADMREAEITEVFTLKIAFLFDSHSMVYDQLTNFPIPQALSFRQKAHTRGVNPRPSNVSGGGAAAITSIIKPYEAPDEFDPKHKILKALLICNDIDAHNVEELSQAFIRNLNLPGLEKSGFLEECITVCDTIKNVTVADLSLLGVAMIQKRTRHHQYLLNLRSAFDQINESIQNMVTDIAQMKLNYHQRVQIIKSFEIDATLASVIESLNITPTIWYAIPYMNKAPLAELGSTGDAASAASPNGDEGMLKCKAKIGELIEHRVIFDGGDIQKDQFVTFSTDPQDLSSPWIIQVGKLTSSIYPHQLPYNYFHKLYLGHTFPIFFTGPLKCFLNTILAFNIT